MDKIQFILSLIAYFVLLPLWGLLVWGFMLAMNLLLKSFRVLKEFISHQITHILNTIKEIALQSNRKILEVIKSLAIWLGVKVLTIKNKWKNNSEIYLTIAKIFIILGSGISSLIYILINCNCKWENIIDGSHCLYLVICFVNFAFFLGLSIKKYVNAFALNKSQLEESWDNFSEKKNTDVFDVWFKMISSNIVLIGTIWNVFIVVLLPCLLSIQGYEIITSKHVTKIEMLNISMAIISVLLALFSLAFARDVKRETDMSLEKISQKIDDIPFLNISDVRSKKTSYYQNE